MYILQAKADVLKSHLVQDKWTPMSIAAAMERVRAVRMFESAGVKISEDAKNMLVQVKRAQQKAADEARARCV